MTTTHAPRQRSTLALLQATAVVLAIAAMAMAIWQWHDTHPLWAVATVSIVVTGHAWVLALECVAAAWHNRHDVALRPTAWEWLHAWWQETRTAPLVFGWRQPFRWHELPDTDRASSDGPGAVVLIHGFVCNRGFWLPWMKALRTNYIPYVSVNLEPVFGSIDEYVDGIEQAVCRAEALTGKRPSLLCHSMGGLAARAWLASQGGQADRVQQLITIGSPHRGTWLAHWSHLDNGRQMRPGDPWLAHLAEREAACLHDRHPLATVCWYANTDNIVFPARTATLPNADNRLIRGAAHVDLAFHPTVMAESLAMLASASSSPERRTAP